MHFLFLKMIQRYRNTKEKESTRAQQTTLALHVAKEESWDLERRAVYTVKQPERGQGMPEGQGAPGGPLPQERRRRKENPEDEGRFRKGAYSMKRWSSSEASAAALVPRVPAAESESWQEENALADRIPKACARSQQMPGVQVIVTEKGGSERRAGPHTLGLGRLLLTGWKGR